jgi:galactokinase
MGSHTDYNLGYVLTLPIGRDTWIAARPREDHSVRLHSLNLAADASFQLDRLAVGRDRCWSDYVRGVAHVLHTESYPLVGYDGVIHSTVPIGSGLSSSAALECAAATVFESLGGWRLTPERKAQLCQRAENDFVKVNCGILDQFTSCAGQMGCALLLDCRDLSSRPVALPEDLQIVICDTQSQRELSGSEYGTRRSQCEEGARRLGVEALRDVSTAMLEESMGQLPPVVGRRCRFIIQENARTLQLAEALTAADRSAIHDLTLESFRGACELYEIGSPAMHAMMQAMTTAPGVVGARQAGAGFGGCMVALVDRSRVEDFAHAASRAYQEATQISPAIYPVEAAAGAGLLCEPPRLRGSAVDSSPRAP